MKLHIGITLRRLAATAGLALALGAMTFLLLLTIVAVVVDWPLLVLTGRNPFATIMAKILVAATNKDAPFIGLLPDDEPELVE